MSQHEDYTLHSSHSSYVKLYALESCAGRINPRGLRVPTFAGRVRKRTKNFNPRRTPICTRNTFCAFFWRMRLISWCHNLVEQYCTAAHQRHLRLWGFSNPFSLGSAKWTHRFARRRVHTQAHWAHRTKRRHSRRTAVKLRMHIACAVRIAY